MNRRQFTKLVAALPIAGMGIVAKLHAEARPIPKPEKIPEFKYGMECPKCKTCLGDVMESCKNEVVRSGSHLNREFGMTEYWFEAKITCFKCGEEFYFATSNL